MGSLLLVSNRGLLRTDAMSRALLVAGGGFASLGVFLWAAPAKDQRNLVVPRTALVIGGGVIGLSSAYQLALRGVHVTVLEERQNTGQVASFCNGAILCQSMAASCASARLIAENPSASVSTRTDHSWGREVFCGQQWGGAQIRAESWPRCPRGRSGGAVRSQGGTFEDGGWKSGRPGSRFWRTGGGRHLYCGCRSNVQQNCCPGWGECSSLPSEGPHGNSKTSRTATKYIQPQARASKPPVWRKSANCRYGGGSGMGSHGGAGQGEAGNGGSQRGLC